ncbi:caspase family protein [Chlorobium ferrooxidans]|uniref:Peptidase C14 caspase domain-containing protein n=1 Tax=Chlorobium ferrooxidans DSM 13031 TaxID=377431 RepID=Q0YPD5_9CHLB|nr:caspase family protein [Chlorobium ferrooxidans]EAT58165.1 hypothetical protein CferDRAFT_0172 [Chlorobium ferrooxidans DSM 13031]
MAASTKKALCVGINNFKNYPAAALQGCVNDAKEMLALLQKLLGFKTADITVLTDAQATKAAIISSLKEMVDGAKAGKYTYLVFCLSSHGTYVPELSGAPMATCSGARLARLLCRQAARGRSMFIMPLRISS